MSADVEEQVSADVEEDAVPSVLEELSTVREAQMEGMDMVYEVAAFEEVLAEEEEIVLQQADLEVAAYEEHIGRPCSPCLTGTQRQRETDSTF